MKTNFEFIIFTKHFKCLSIEKLIETMRIIGSNGVDLCIREGYLVNMGNIERSLPEVSEKFKREGLTIPLITTPTNFVNPEDSSVEKVFSTCQKAEVKFIKLGYWYMEEDGYWKTVDRIRKKIEKFVKMAEKYKVKVLIHNHSGGTMGLNSCSVMNLIEGFNPEYIGVFIDPGHLSIVGEPLPMALSIVEKYLSAVACKDIIRERLLIDGKRKWVRRIVPLGEGYVDWEELIKILIKLKFSGPLSIHSEYSELEISDLIDQTKMDLRFLKRIIKENEEKRD